MTHDSSTSTDLSALPEDVARLLGDFRTPPELAATTVIRMERRLALATLVAGGTVAASLAHSAGTHAAKATPAASFSPVAIVLSFLSRRVPFSISALLVGAGVGAGAHALATRQPTNTPNLVRVTSIQDRESIAPVLDSAASAGTPTPTLASAASANLTSAATDRASTPVHYAHDFPPAAALSTSSASPNSAGPNSASPNSATSGALSSGAARPLPASQLSEERALLEVGRTALARGDNAAALGAATRHEQAFAGGSLREEREYLAIQALVGLGRNMEAQKRGTAFLTGYPKSMFAASVRTALHLPNAELP